MKKTITISQLFPAEVSAWDEDEKERRAAAGREVLEQIRRAGRDGSGTVRIPPSDHLFPPEHISSQSIRTGTSGLY